MDLMARKAWTLGETSSEDPKIPRQVLRNLSPSFLKGPKRDTLALSLRRTKASRGASVTVAMRWRETPQ